MATIPASENVFPEVLLSEVAAPAAAATGQVRLYAKSDGLLYSKDDAGTETEAGAGSHIADTADAHDASAVSFDPTALVNITGTEVQTALEELDAAVAGGGISATILAAKGDILGASANDTAAITTVGTNGQILKADSTAGAGLAWSDFDHTHAVAGIGATGGGATLNVPTVNVTQHLRLSGVTTSTINADQNDWNPTGIHVTPIFYFASFSANRTITGINAGTVGEVLILQNNNTFSLLLPNESGSSSAANRFRTPNAATHTIRQAGSAMLIYIASRWCVIAA